MLLAYMFPLTGSQRVRSFGLDDIVRVVLLAFVMAQIYGAMKPTSPMLMLVDVSSFISCQLIIKPPTPCVSLISLPFSLPFSPFALISSFLYRHNLLLR